MEKLNRRRGKDSISNYLTRLARSLYMSDLYQLSLDRLLKEEKSMSNNLDYTKDSTNVVKSDKHVSWLILCLSYLVIWVFGLIVFWFFTNGSDAMGFGFVFLWILLPATTFVVSLLTAVNNYWGRYKWIVALIMGAMYMVAEYATFSVANMVAFSKINLPEFSMIIIGAVISLLGMGIGTLIHRWLK